MTAERGALPIANTSPLVSWKPIEVTRSRRPAPATCRRKDRAAHRPPTVRSPMLTRKVSRHVGCRSTRWQASASAPRELERFRVRSVAPDLAVMRAACRTAPTAPCRRAVVELRVLDDSRASSVATPTTAKGQALAFTDGPELPMRSGGDREHEAFLAFVAPQLARRHAGLFVGQGGKIDAGAPPAIWASSAARSTDRPHRRRESRAPDCPGPSCQQRSMTSGRAFASRIARCTNRNPGSRDWRPCPCSMRRPPIPISIPGPPSCTSSAPGANGDFSACTALMLPSPPAIMIGLW